MATFYTSEVTGYEGTNGWVSLSDGYPDRLKVTYSTAIDSSGKVNVTWKVEGNASEGAKSSSTYTKIYACTLTIDGTKVLSKTWTSGNLYHGTVLGSGTHSLAASKAGTSINIVADAIIYGSATHSKKTQAVTLPTPNKLRLAYHPNGGTLGNTSTYSLNKYGYITDKNTGDWDFHTVYYPNKVNPRNATTNSNNHFYLTKTGYTFKCWSPILNNVVQYSTTFYQGSSYDISLFHSTTDASKNASNTSSVDCYLWANWTPNTYTVNFNANNGTIPAGSGWTGSGSTANKTVTYDSTYGTLPTPTKAGHYFEGWYTAKSGGSKVNSSTKVSITGNQTLYARWTAKTIHVIFQKNDGSGDIADQYFTYGLGHTKNKFGYTTEGQPFWGTVTNKYAIDFGFGHWYRNGYKIIGWAHSPSATTPDYTTYSGVDDSWINRQVGNATSKTIDLYAVWDYNGTVRIYKDGAWKMALPYVYAKVGTETSPSWHLALPYTYAQGTGETSPSWHLNGG